MDKKILTLVVETNGTEEFRWIFKSFSRRLIDPVESEKNGIQVLNVDEGDKLAAYYEMEKERNTLLDQNERLQIELNAALNELTDLRPADPKDGLDN